MSENDSSNLERERLEIEKMKLEVELKKLDLEKTRTMVGENTIFSRETKFNFKSVNILALIFALISIITIALPWVKGVAEGSVDIPGFKSSSNFSSGILSGFNTSEGQLCIILTLIGAWLNIKNNRLAGIIGILCFLLITVFIYRMSQIHSDVSTYGASGSFRMKIQDEILVSLISYLIYSIVSFWNFLKSKIARTNVLVFSIGTIVYSSLYLLIEEHTILFFLASFAIGLIFFKKFNLLLSRWLLIIFSSIVILNYIIYLLRSSYWNSSSKYIRPLFDQSDDIFEMFAYGAVHIFGVMFLLEFIFKCINKPELGSDIRKSKFMKIAVAAYALLSIGLPAFNYAAVIAKFHSITEADRKKALGLLEGYLDETWCLSNPEMNGSYYPLKFQSPQIESEDEFGFLTIKYSLVFGKNDALYEVGEGLDYKTIKRDKEYVFSENTENHLIKVTYTSADTITVEYISKTWRGDWDYEGSEKLLGVKESIFFKGKQKVDNGLKELTEMHYILPSIQNFEDKSIKLHNEYFPKLKQYLSSINLFKEYNRLKNNEVFRMIISADSSLIVGNSMWFDGAWIPDNFLVYNVSPQLFSFFISPRTDFMFATYESALRLNANSFLLLGVIDGNGAMNNYALQYVDVSKSDFGIHQQVFGDTSSFYIFPSNLPEESSFRPVQQTSANRFSIVTYIKSTDEGNELKSHTGEIIWDGSKFIVNYSKLPISNEPLPSM